MSIILVHLQIPVIFLLSPSFSRFPDYPSIPKMAAKRLVQYIAIRKDLSSSLSWPGGAVIAQACHACTAVTILFRDDSYTKDYVQELDSMRKVIVEVCMYVILFVLFILILPVHLRE